MLAGVGCAPLSLDHRVTCCLQVRALVGHPLMPMTVTGERQFFISVRHGALVQKDVSARDVCVHVRWHV
jgi:hypothetical protein